MNYEHVRTSLTINTVFFFLKKNRFREQQLQLVPLQINFLTQQVSESY